jgi:hypothetical protein
MNKILFSMVSSVYKWLSFSVIGCFFIIQAFAPGNKPVPSFAGSGASHPVHISTTEINHNAADKTLEVSCRVFIDDFETCLSKVYHTKIDLSAASMKVAMDTLVKKYLSSHLQLKADDKTVQMQYLGFEKESEAVYAYLQVDNVAAVKKVEVINSILYDLYDDQISIIHVIVGGNRKSTRLNYPDRQAVISF